MALLIRWIVNTLALFAVAYIVPGFHYRSWVSLAIAAAVLGILNTVLKPILVILTLPLTVITLGIFLLILNALMLKLTAGLVPGFGVDSWLSAIIGALLLSIISMVTGGVGRERGEQRR